MVEIMESGFVPPSEETPKHWLWLSNLDIKGNRDHTPTVYIYRPNGHPDFFSVEALKAGLGKALVPFYPMAGRLGLNRSGRVEINCTGEGVLFVVARSESSINELGDFAPSPEMRKLLVPSVESAEPPSILFMVQVTFFKCGGVTLGTAVHHIAIDGHSALHFINAWSDITRGITDLTIHPFLDRSLLHARSPPTVAFDHIEYKPNSNPSAPTPPFVSTILKLSKNQLILLKSSGCNKKELSTFRAVIAHVWRCVCIARQLAAAEETRLSLITNVRSRLSPQLPPGYFGNAVCRTSATATAGEIVSNPLHFGADKIHSATTQVNNEFVRSVIDYIELEKNERGWMHPSSNLHVVSWLGMPIYDADFGWGKPEFMGRASMIRVGFVYIMHSPGDDGGVSVPIALETANMERLKKVFYEELDRVKGV